MFDALSDRLIGILAMDENKRLFGLSARKALIGLACCLSLSACSSSESDDVALLSDSSAAQVGNVPPAAPTAPEESPEQDTPTVPDISIDPDIPLAPVDLPDLPGEHLSAVSDPQVDADNQISWLFNAVDEGRQLVVEPFVEMPLASNGRPARWNDLEFFGDRLFVVDEQDGKVFEITGGEPVLWFDIKSAIQSATGRSLSISNVFHGGVRGMAFHPDFEINGKFYTSVMEQRPVDPSLHTYLSDSAGTVDADSVLIEWTASTNTLAIDASSYREVFRIGIPEYDHPIKQIAFNPSAVPGDAEYGLLYVAHGDGSVESTTAVGGQGNNALGKILRINPLATAESGFSVPQSNPFINDASLPDAVFSYGHRNPHHLSFTRAGQLLAAETGRDNIDEVNLIARGADYGWAEREGAYVQLAGGALVTGISALPDDDALNGYVYPVIQYGHTAVVGAAVTRQALGGGFVVENGSVLDGQYFYIDFVRSGQIFHSSLTDILQATTRGAPSTLTVAKSYLATVAFDHDANADTEALDNSMQEVVFSANGFINFDGRVDVRIGQGPRGELYLMSKRNNQIYRVSNSLPQ